MICSTFSKHPHNYPPHYPVEVLVCAGATVVARDRNGSIREYVDWGMGLGGTGVLGHMAIHGVSLTPAVCHIPFAKEREVAERLCSVLPGFAEEARFCLNGTDATASAVRLARAVTGRETIITFKGAYHGDSGADWAIAGKEPGRGVPKNYPRRLELEWNNPRLLEATLRERDDLAAVIFELQERPSPDFVEALNRVSTHAVLIADEVVTGFRFALGGACEVYGIQPDLACYGKALGSGVPVAALVGRKDLMSEFDTPPNSVFMSYTHAGNLACLDAVEMTIMLLEHEDFGQLWELGQWLTDSFVSLFGECGGYAAGEPPNSQFRFHGDPDREKFRLFQDGMAKHGVLVMLSNKPSFAHAAKDQQQTRLAMESTSRQMRHELAGVTMT